MLSAQTDDTRWFQALHHLLVPVLAEGGKQREENNEDAAFFA
jgi:hypothetical protein